MTLLDVITNIQSNDQTFLLHSPDPWPDKNDHNPYKWIEKLGHLSPSIHLKQKTKDIYTHKPFIKKYNKIGIIKPNKVISSIKKSKIKECTLYFEFSFREREPFDSRAIKDIKESVNYWRDYINV